MAIMEREWIRIQLFFFTLKLISFDDCVRDVGIGVFGSVCFGLSNNLKSHVTQNNSN